MSVECGFNVCFMATLLLQNNSGSLKKEEGKSNRVQAMVYKIK